MREHVCAPTYTHAHTARPFREGQGEAVPRAWDCHLRHSLLPAQARHPPTTRGGKSTTQLLKIAGCHACSFAAPMLAVTVCCHRDSASLGHIWLVGGEGGRDEGGSQKYIRDSSKVNYTYSPSPTPTHPLPPCPQLDAMGGVSIAT